MYLFVFLQIEELKLAANRKMLEKRVVEFLYGKKHKANTYTPICFLITATALLCCAPACREKRIEHNFCVETLATNIKKHIGRIGHRSKYVKKTSYSRHRLVFFEKEFNKSVFRNFTVTI